MKRLGRRARLKAPSRTTDERLIDQGFEKKHWFLCTCSMTRNNAIAQLSPTTVGKDSKQDDIIGQREGDTSIMQPLIEKKETECRTRETQRASHPNP